MSNTSGQICIFLVALASANCLPALAQPLPPPAFSVGITAPGLSCTDGRDGAVPQSFSLDCAGQYGGHNYSVQGTAETFGGIRPMAAAQAHAGSSSGFTYQVTASASVDYYVRIRAHTPPPPGTYSVPARALVRGAATGYAWSQVRIGYLLPIEVSTSYNAEYASYDTSVQLSFNPNNPELNITFVRLRATATGYNGNLQWASSSQAYADPLFSLDQAAFDLEQGANTFPLSDYFEFEYSEYLLNPPAPPAVTVHPQNQTMCEGGAAMFSADAASTAPLTYQWRLNGSALSDVDGISGSATSTLSIDPALWYYSGVYDCLISNIAGSVTTNPAILTASMPVTIDYPPQPVEVAPGQLATFTVYTSGTDQMYQWRRNEINLIDDGRITGATTSTLSIDLAQASDAGTYDVIVSNTCNTQTSDPALLTVTGTCTADFNGDTAVDFFDYLDFVDAFSAQLPAADFNQDTSIDFFDYLDFVDAFSIGC